MSVEATVIVPTHNHGPTLHASVRSALDQSVPLEVFILGDGATGETRSIAQQLAREHAPVRFFDHPKHGARGEKYRHSALAQARGRVVCYLSDDDLYLPHHVEDMCSLLRDADFVHAQAVEVLLDNDIASWTVDLSLPAFQREVLGGGNRVPLSAGAHTLSAYHSLAEGWTSPPPGIASDLHMWRKFVRHPGCRFRPGQRPSVLVFPSPKRTHLSNDERLSEMRRWTADTAGDAALAWLNQRVLAFKTAELAEVHARRMEEIDTGVTPPSDFDFQVFFPSAGGHNRRDSARFPVTPGEWRKISARFPYPASAVPIRIDPSNRPCLIELSQIDVRDSSQNLLWQLTGKSCHELQIGGTAVAIHQGAPLLALSDGLTPQILLPSLQLSREQEMVELEVTIRLDADLQRLAGVFSDHLRRARNQHLLAKLRSVIIPP